MFELSLPVIFETEAGFATLYFDDFPLKFCDLDNQEIEYDFDIESAYEDIWERWHELYSH
jgi:hypothetical protein